MNNKADTKVVSMGMALKEMPTVGHEVLGIDSDGSESEDDSDMDSWGPDIDASDIVEDDEFPDKGGDMLEINDGEVAELIKVLTTPVEYLGRQVPALSGKEVQLFISDIQGGTTRAQKKPRKGPKTKSRAKGA